MTPEELDMFVIGGGINGAGFARDAALGDRMGRSAAPHGPT